MSKILTIFLICFSLNAASPKFDYSKEFKLKKDEKASIIFTYKNDLSRDDFVFSWTLFDNTNLVLHTKFRKYPRQIVLSRRPGLELYRQNILTDLKSPLKDEVTLYLEFKNYEKGVATFMAYITDKTKRVEVEFLPNEGKN